MDAFTAGLLLGVSQSNPDLGARLYKDFQGPGSSHDDVARANAMAGRRCRITHSTYKGTVKGANLAQGGFYGGERYPVLVCIDETCDGNKNVTFEYSFDNVELID